MVCREQNKINEAKRDKEHRREIARKNEAKPECRERKQKWRDDNYEKATSYWMKSRENKLNELGVEGYLKYNAEQAKKWREKNKDKMEEANENKKNSMETNYGVYKRSANDKNLEFTITEEEYSTIVIVTLVMNHFHVITGELLIRPCPRLATYKSSQNKFSKRRGKGG